ncbi:MAG: polysaccharide biosynthesis tyrosine autokinase [Acidobacteriota bacterium]|jgi:capsular exopolysaccharide synthesis family protein
MDDKTTTTARPEAHLRDYWRVVWNGRWSVISIFAVVVVLGTIATLLQKPSYESAVTIEINARPRAMVQGADVAQLGATDFGYLAEERYYNTQYQIMKSRDVLSRTMTSLDLFEHPAFAQAEDPVEAFARRIVVNPVSETGIVKLRVRAGDPESAALWANTLAETYKERNLAKAAEKTDEAVNRLRQRLLPLRNQLLEEEQRRMEFAEDAELYVGDDPQKSFQERLKLLDADLTQAQVDRLAMEGIYQKLQEIQREGGDYLVVPRIATDPTILGLQEDAIRLETELRRLLVTYKPGHFKVKEKESELDRVQQRMDLEIQRVSGAIETEYNLLRGREQELKDAIDDTRQQSMALGRKASEYEVFKTDSSEARKVYDLISNRIKEVELNANLLRNNVTIVDQAVVPREPVSPKRRLNVLLSAVLGLALGLGLVFFLDYLDNTVKTSEDVEQYLGLSILAIVPRRSEAAEPMLRESFSSLRTNINFSSLNRSRKLLLITSAGPQEGKTSTVTTLARSQAASGDRVVVVDCDLRRPNVHNLLRLKRNFGLTNYLADASEDGSWRKYLKQTDSPNLQVLTCGPIPPNPPELFGTERFRRLLEELREEYDWVLIDAPPVASLTDAVILASLVDMVAFVIRHRHNDRELIRRAVESLRAVNGQIVGAILNDVNLDRTHYRDYYYSGHYYYGSGEGEKEPKRRFLKGRRAG